MIKHATRPFAALSTAFLEIGKKLDMRHIKDYIMCYEVCMSHLSIRIPDALLAELNEWSENKSKAEVIREALELYRKDQLAKRRIARLTQASLLVRAESMDVNREFQAFEDDIHEA